MNPLRILWDALKLWWQHWIGILFLNVVWFLLLLPVVTAPAATMMFYAIGRRMVRDEVWDWQDVWGCLRDNLWSAWRWAFPNLLIALVLAGNFYAYRDFSGGLWYALRAVWGVLTIVWLMFNLYYWPFWLAQEDKSLRLTYANCVRFFVMHSWSVLVLTMISLILLILSVRFVLPFVLGLTGWLVLLGTLSVERSLDLSRASKG